MPDRVRLHNGTVTLLGASFATLFRRIRFGGRKGRAAARRIAGQVHWYAYQDGTRIPLLVSWPNAQSVAAARSAS